MWSAVSSNHVLLAAGAAREQYRYRTDSGELTHELTEYSKNSVTILVLPLRLSVWPCFRFVAMPGAP